MVVRVKHPRMAAGADFRMTLSRCSLTAKPSDGDVLVVDMSITSLPGNLVNLTELVTISPSRHYFSPDNWTLEPNMLVSVKGACCAPPDTPQPPWRCWEGMPLPDLASRCHWCTACLAHCSPKGHPQRVMTLLEVPFPVLCTLPQTELFWEGVEAQSASECFHVVP